MERSCDAKVLNREEGANAKVFLKDIRSYVQQCKVFSSNNNISKALTELFLIQ